MTAAADRKVRPIAPKKLNAARYAELLSKTLPVAVATEAEYDRSLEVVNMLMSIAEDKMTREESALLELLFTLIEKYEDEHHPIEEARGCEVLKLVMEDRGLKQSDLVPRIGSRGVVSDLLNGKRPIGKTTAKKLGEFFGMRPEMFFDWK